MCGIILILSFYCFGEKLEKMKIGVVLVILGIFISTASMYAMAKKPNGDYSNTDNNIEQRAIDFLVRVPTFSFDGVPESIEVISTYTLESFPEQHVVVLFFETTHSGWGNREGTFIAQVITLHTIKITIVEDEVVEALIDDKWDELKQEVIIPEELLLPEFAKEKAIQHIIDTHSELRELELPEIWITEREANVGFLGSTSLKYLAEGWNMTVRFPVIRFPDYRVNIDYTGEINFHWSGKVSRNGEVSEISIDIN